jgi:dUTPase
MSLKVQLLEKTSKEPTINSDNSYDIYSSEVKLIRAGGNAIVNTGISLMCPVGFYMLTISGPLSQSNNIETSTFSSNNLQSFKFASGESRATNGNVILRNNGITNFTIEPGMIIARLVILRCKNLPVELVENINQQNKPETNKVQLEKPKIKSMNKTAKHWFQKIYEDNPSEVTIKYCLDSMNVKVEEFKQQPEFEESVHQLTTLSAFLWKEMPSDLKRNIKNDFNEMRQKVLDSLPTEESTTQSTARSTTTQQTQEDENDPEDNIEQINDDA